jgi:heme-degrading monooxygenase HmoA
MTVGADHRRQEGGRIVLDIYTHTTWRVKPGLEDEFVARWTDWVEWSRLQGLGAHARLLSDVDKPGTFVSFGPWEDIGAVRNWRSLPGYQERVARLREVVESFQPTTLSLIAER